MYKKITDIILFIISLFFFLLMSCSPLLIPMDRHLEIVDLMDFLPGSLFWGGMICGGICQVVLNIRRKQTLEKQGARKNQARKGRNGLICFFKNIPAIISDVTCVVSLAGLIVTTVISNGNDYIWLAMLTVFLFTFCLHCIFNGRIYHYLFQRD